MVEGSSNVLKAVPYRLVFFVLVHKLVQPTPIFRLASNAGLYRAVPEISAAFNHFGRKMCFGLGCFFWAAQCSLCRRSPQSLTLKEGGEGARLISGRETEYISLCCEVERFWKRNCPGDLDIFGADQRSIL
jgi:hypothetical protein